MPSGSLVPSSAQLCGAQLVLSVEERISIFTLFIDVTGHGHAHPVKSSCLSHSRHYATKTADQVPLLAVDYGTRGMIFCRIRYGVGGRGGCGWHYSRFSYGWIPHPSAHPHLGRLSLPGSGWRRVTLASRAPRYTGIIE